MSPDLEACQPSQGPLDAELLQRPLFVERLLAASPGLVYLCDLDNRRAEFANGSLAAFLGFAADPANPGGTFAPAIHPEDAEAVREHHARLAQAADGATLTLEFRMRHADGQWHWLRARDVVFSRGAGGVPDRILGIAEDINQERQALEALQASEELFSRAFRLSPDSINLNQMEDGVYLDVNQGFTQMTGYSREEVLGRSSTSSDLAIWVHDEDRARLREEIRAHGEMTGLEALFRRKDGSILHGLMSARLLEVKGKPALLTITRDITERKRAEELRNRLEAELHQAQKLESLGSLAGGIAHDMNNVLAAIQAVTETLKLVHAGQTPLVKALDTIEKASTRGRDLVRSLTNFARKDLREPEWLDLNALVREEGDLLGRTTLKKVELALDLDPVLPTVYGERGALGSALMNLCVNAVDAMPRGGRLTIRTRLRPDAQVELAVLDTGTGMTAEVLARAMEPFYTTKSQGKGTGLGLAMVYATAKAHGGSVALWSEPDRGTSVVICLPVAGKAGLAVPPAEATAPSSVPMRILLVDDDELIRASLPPMVEFFGHQVEVAAGGREALERLRQAPGVDLVILDLNMPDLDGLETLKRLRRLCPDLPVLLATGRLDDATINTLRKDGKALGILKPFTMAELDLKFKVLETLRHSSGTTR